MYDPLFKSISLPIVYALCLEHGRPLARDRQRDCTVADASWIPGNHGQSKMPLINYITFHFEAWIELLNLVRVCSHCYMFMYNFVFPHYRLYVMTAKPIAQYLSMCWEWSAAPVAHTTQHRMEGSSSSIRQSRTLRMRQEQTQSRKSNLSHPPLNKTAYHRQLE